MTKTRIDPGICGLPSVVEVEKKPGQKFSVKIRSECPMVTELAAEISDIELMEIFKPILENPVHRKASGALRHAACPVVSGIIKAVEVEAGMALPKKVEIEFDEDP